MFVSKFSKFFACSLSLNCFSFSFSNICAMEHLNPNLDTSKKIIGGDKIQLNFKNHDCKSSCLNKISGKSYFLTIKDANNNLEAIYNMCHECAMEKINAHNYRPNFRYELKDADFSSSDGWVLYVNYLRKTLKNIFKENEEETIELSTIENIDNEIDRISHLKDGYDIINDLIGKMLGDEIHYYDKSREKEIRNYVKRKLSGFDENKIVDLITHVYIWNAKRPTDEVTGFPVDVRIIENFLKK